MAAAEMKVLFTYVPQKCAALPYAATAWFTGASNENSLGPFLPQQKKKCCDILATAYWKPTMSRM